MPIVIDDEKFNLSSFGEKSNEKFVGEFRSKKRLSMIDHIESDRMYRDLLGGINPAHANQLASNVAFMVAELSVRLTKTPKWWQEMRGGLLLTDNNILGEVYEMAVMVEKKAIDADSEAAEQDKTELRKLDTAE